MLWHPQYASGSGHCCRSAPRTESEATGGLGIGSTLRLAIEACREALIACREYEHLRSRGISHDAALRHALGAGPAPAQHRCRAAHPIYFAGRA